MRQEIVFYVNGVKKSVSGQDVFLSLSSYLRYEAHLTGTKVVCAEGDCGACTVMMSAWTPQGFKEYQSLNSCIAMVFSMDGANLVTVEGLKNAEEGADNYTEVQCSMIRNFGGQCGFCTPGFVMSITSMFEIKSTQNRSEQNVKNHLTGNLCRCTGYQPIIKAALDVNLEKHVLVKHKFPPIDVSNQMKNEVFITTPDCDYYAPRTLQRACDYLTKNTEVQIYSGGTDLGVQINKAFIKPKKILSLHLIEELYTLKNENSQVWVGARVSLTELQKFIQDKIPSMDHFLNIFASPQIKNVATLIGNIVNASPIADMIPVLMALDAEVVIYGPAGPRTIELKDFYLGYKKINLSKDEIVIQLKFGIPNYKNNKVQNYKVSQRRDLDISTINASFNFCMQGAKIIRARLVYGGVAATVIRLTAIENQIEGQDVSKQMVVDFKKRIRAAIQPLSDLRGSAEYRKLVAANLFEKFMNEIMEELSESEISNSETPGMRP